MTSLGVEPSINVDWFIWRPVLRQVATLQEIETHWTIYDLLDCHEALDVIDDLESARNKKAEAEARRKR